MLYALLLPWRSDLSFLLLPQAPELHAQLHAQMRAQQEEGEVRLWHSMFSRFSICRPLH